MKTAGSTGIKSEGMVKKEGGDNLSKAAATYGASAEGGSGSGSGNTTSNSKIAATSTNTRGLSPPPPTTFRDIPLYSSALKDDFKFHLMKIASFTKIDPSDPTQFPWPVKLNRKWPPRLKDELPLQGDPVLDSYGKPILVPPRKDGSELNVPSSLLPSEARKKIPLLWPGPDDDVNEVESLLARLEGPKAPTADTSLIGPSNTSNIATRAKSGLFQKRVREVYKSSSVARKTHNEELLPWILEDYETGKEWESRRKESRRGIKALQEGIKIRKEGGQFPSRSSKAGEITVKKEEDEVKKEETVAEEKEDKELQKDSATKHNHAPWIGKLEGEAHASASTSSGGAMSHALLIFDERNQGGFRVVPVGRMYKFLQKPAYANNLSWEEAEKAYERHQKAQAGEGISKYLSRNVDGRGPVVSRQTRAKNEEEDQEFITSLSQSRGISLPGSKGRGSKGSSNNFHLASMYDRDSYARRNNLMAVGGSSARGTRIKQEEGTYAELAFEEDFADDEERNEGDDYAMGEEETKELEQKIKSEMARAEEQEKEEDDNDDDLFDERGRSRNRRGEDDALTGSGKQMKKIMKALARREGNDVYDDDDEDRNPYGSEDSSDEGENSVMANPEEALRRVREEREREAKEAAKNGVVKTEGDVSNDQSRGVSPAAISTPSSMTTKSAPLPNSQGLHRPGAGHATAAQRATSPNRHSTNSSRKDSRSGSPIDANTSASLKRKSDSSSNSNSNNNNNNGKRPRTSTQQSTSPSPRSASPSRPGGRNPAIAPPSELEMEIINLVRNGKARTAKELIGHFKSKLTSADSMKNFTKAVTRVLDTNNPQKILNVKPGLVD
ncbi:hypothetical protein CBS101457_001022 [Exobasidium rhododendri]|nr:hypothetical protein CBS101457_001022 [Exobasidium rhododendri]